MTVIAWDGCTLAADKRCTIGGLVVAVSKIVHHNGCLIASTGDGSFVDQVQYAQGFEFDEFLYHQDTPAALIEALLPFLGRGLELQP